MTRTHPPAGSFDRDPIRRRDGVTLIELLVVIGIISILAALLMPGLRAARQRSAMSSCASNLRQVYLALEMYADDNEEYYPKAISLGVWNSTDESSIGWMQRIFPYARNAKVFRCPGQPKDTENDFSYFLGSRAAYVAAGNQFSAFNRRDLKIAGQYILSGDTTLASFNKQDTDKDNYSQDCLFTWSQTLRRVPLYHVGRVNVLFGDGHVRASKGFEASEMTYDYDQGGVDFDITEPGH